MSKHLGENLSRLMAGAGVSLAELAKRTGLDQRTIRGIVRGAHRPHSHTLRRLADGLGASVDELFIDPSQLLYRHFDRATNPVVEEAIQARPELFAGWGQADFDELHSRVGTGGALTLQGALAAAAQMNRKSQLHDKLDLLLESSQSEAIAGIVELLYAQITVDGSAAGPDRVRSRCR